MNEQISMQQLKEQRLTPAEKFVLDKINGAKASEPDEDGDVEWFDKDGKWLFEQDFKNGDIYVCYEYIWSVLVKEYGLNHNEIKRLIKNVMYNHTNNGQLTPKHHPTPEMLNMYNHTNNGQLKISL